VFGTSWKIARVGGVDIRVDTSWLLIAAFVAYSFFLRADTLYPELDGAGAVALAVVAAVALFSSILVHELAHALVARARGIHVGGITLFLLGGVTEANAESRTARDEFVIAVVGPLTSVGVGAVLWGVASFLGATDEPVAGTIGYLAWTNLALAVFNILPGLPLDGGRVLHSGIWAATGDVRRATRVAARSGQALGYGLVVLGVWSLVMGAGGLWLAFIGWFLAQSAKASYAQLRLRRLLDGVTVADVMSTQLVCVDAGLTVEQALQDHFLRYDHAAFPVVTDGRAVGLVTIRAIRRIPREQRPELRVSDVMVPLQDTCSVPPDHPLERVVEWFGEHDGDRVLVRDSRGLLGIVSPSDVARWVRRIEDFDLRRSGTGIRT
jgi:Zn-dependent protease/predicted transcriptional regulator